LAEWDSAPLMLHEMAEGDDMGGKLPCPSDR
jgi:hypothetical protein